MPFSDLRPWICLQHSFAPTVRLEQGTDADGGVTLTAVALAALDAGAGLTFDYTLHR